MSLLPEDKAYLDTIGLQYHVDREPGYQCVIILEFPLPDGFDHATTDLLLRLPVGFPDTPPDMWWCWPPLKVLSTNEYPVAADCMEHHVGRLWQRFSRHFTPGQWQPGESGIATFLAVIRTDFASSGADER